MTDPHENPDDARDLLFDHESDPRNRGVAAGATYAAARRNPLCGDEVSISVRVEGGVAAEVRWEGRGCGLSRASASRLCEAAQGRPVTELLDPTAFAPSFGLPLSPPKRVCETLPLLALRAALAIRKHFPPQSEA